MVREAMESEEIRRSAQALAQEVRRDIAEGGSSSEEFKRLVGFINVQRRDLRMAPVAGEGEHELEHRGRLGGRGVVER
jgi:hypothetical protein